MVLTNQINFLFQIYMELYKFEKCAKLFLDTALFGPNGTIAPPFDTTQGTSDPPRINCTFTNLNWRVILGDMFDEFETFNLVPVSITYLNSGGTPFAAALQGEKVFIKATGLDWLDQTYDVYKKCKSSSCVIYAGHAFRQPIPTNVTELNPCTFRRPSGNGIRDFTLQIYKCWDESQTPLSSLGGGTYVDRNVAMSYLFNIYGVDKVRRRT